MNEGLEFPNRPFPVVNKLKMHNNGSISVEEEINQELVVGNKFDAFCIQDQIFVNTKGFIQLTDLKMNYGIDIDPISEKTWTEFRQHVDASDAGNVTCFTFDRKKTRLGSINLAYKCQLKLQPQLLNI